jgi:hypothetical protein
VTKFLEVKPRYITFDKLGTASWFTEAIGRFGKTKKAVKLCHNPDCAQPDTAVLVKLGKKTKFKVFNAGTAPLAGFFELSDRAG